MTVVGRIEGRSWGDVEMSCFCCFLSKLSMEDELVVVVTGTTGGGDLGSGDDMCDDGLLDDEG